MNTQTISFEKQPHCTITGPDSGELIPDKFAREMPSAWKSIVDFVASLLMLVPALPLMAISMAVVRLTSRGAALYSQTRLGKDGRPFQIYKIRSMVLDSEISGPRWSTKGDPRVTPVGRFLRRSHLDELPQLWNILKGEMSLVGPRPERPEFVKQLEVALPRYRGRLTVKPGVTGLAQVQLPPDTDLESVRRKLDCDLRYIEIVGPWLDLRIIACTALGLLGIPHSVSRNVLRVPTLDEPVEVDASAEPARTHVRSR